MSILYPASSQAMSAVRRRAPNPVSCGVCTFLVAVVLLRNLPCTYFDCMWDNPVAVVDHPGKVEQAMFWPPFLGPSSTGGEQCGS